MAEYGNENGKEIADFHFWSLNSQRLCGPYIPDRQAGQRLEYRSEYYGDHSENWIVSLWNGKETHRWSMRIVVMINWQSWLDDVFKEA